MTITLLAATLLALALPLAVYGLVPARAGVDSRRFNRPLPARAPGTGPADPQVLPPMLRWISTASARRRLERNLSLAGLSAPRPVARVLRIKLIASGVALALGIL